MATITQLTALSIVHEFISSDPDMLLPICDKYSCSPDDIIDNIKHQIDMRQKNGAKTSNAPSKVRIQNLNTVNSVVVPFVNNASDVVTAKVLANGAGSPEILTSQKAAKLLELAYNEGLIGRVKYANTYRYANTDFDFEGYVEKLEKEKAARKAARKQKEDKED